MERKLKLEVEKEYGSEIYSRDCDILANILFEQTGKKVSSTTLKRMWGYAKKVKPRRYTLDALSQYLGYKSWLDFNEKNGNGDHSKIGSFIDIPVEELEQDAVVEIKYHPDRRIRFKYMGEREFQVLDSVNSKLRQKDIITTAFFMLKQPFIVEKLVRDGQVLGQYKAAGKGGLTSVKIVSEKAQAE